MGRKTGVYFLLVIFVGLAYLGDLAVYDEYGAFTISGDVFSTEGDCSDDKSDPSCPDSAAPSTISPLPEPPLKRNVTLSLESEETTKWLPGSPPLIRAPPR